LELELEEKEVATYQRKMEASSKEKDVSLTVISARRRRLQAMRMQFFHCTLPLLPLRQSLLVVVEVQFFSITVTNLFWHVRQSSREGN